MSLPLIPPPTYTGLLDVDEKTGSKSFNGAWLQWLMRLADYAKFIKDQIAVQLPIIVRVISQSSVPVGVPSNGSFTGTTLTVTNAFKTIYSGGIFLYFPASVTGIAGFYWVVMSSTTVGVIMGNRWSIGPPKIPAVTISPPAITPGAYTTPLNVDLPIMSIVVPANTMGIQGRMEVNYSIGTSGLGNSYTVTILAGASTAYTNNASGISGITQDSRILQMHNRGMTGAQVCTGVTGAVNATGFAHFFTSEDMTVDKTLILNWKQTNASQFGVMETCSVINYV